MGEKIVKIITELDIVAARQLGREVAKSIGFNKVDQARITTAISELAMNIFLYANVGEIIISIIEKEEKKGISIIAKDQGSGIIDVRKVLEDGYSTNGGKGAGLPAVQRLMDTIDIQSELDKGTTIKVEKWLR